MTEKFESKFHKQYVGGLGEVEQALFTRLSTIKNITPQSIEEIEELYRMYMHDAKAKLPQGVIDSLIALGKLEKNGKA